MKLTNNKKGVELTLQTIVIFIITIIVLIVMIYFFSTHYGQGNQDIIKIGSEIISDSKIN